jgi:hypothetical protein
MPPFCFSLAVLEMEPHELFALADLELPYLNSAFQIARITDMSQ